jgi:HPr kinase/phosphorylase
MSRPATIHASAVLLGERGILIRGASGAGKSTIALDLLASDPRGARLVADDRVILTPAHGRLLADVPGEVAGLLEIRGVGIVPMPYIAPVVVRLVVDLVTAGTAPRMPEADDMTVSLEGISLPRLALPAGAGGAQRIRAAVVLGFAG